MHQDRMVVEQLTVPPNHMAVRSNGVHKLASLLLPVHPLTTYGAGANRPRLLFQGTCDVSAPCVISPSLSEAHLRRCCNCSHSPIWYTPRHQLWFDPVRLVSR